MTKATRVVEAEYDEISTVDRPANQYGQIVIAKRATQEDAVPDNEEDMIFDEEGYELDPDDLALGDVVYASDGSAFEVTEDDDDYEYADDGELVGVGKSARTNAVRQGVAHGASFVRANATAARGNAREGMRIGRQYAKAGGQTQGKKATEAWQRKQKAFGRAGNAGMAIGRHGALVGETAAAGGAVGGGVYGVHEARKSFDLDDIRTELSKAITEADQVSVLTKAFEGVEARAQQAEARIQQSEAIAKSERDLRLSREYIAKAAEYNVPIAPEQLGPVLMRMAESMDYADCAVIHKALTTSGALLEEIGKSGGGTNHDPFAQIDELLGGEVSKAFGGDESISKEHKVTSYFDDNPEAYEQYRAARSGR